MVESLSGKRFDRWIVGKRTPPKDTGRRQKQAFYLCVCSCGTKRPVKASDLRTGRSTCCGCKGRGRKRPFEATYNTLVYKEPHRAKGFSYEDYITFTVIHNCHYCGGSIRWLPHRKKEPWGQGHNLDRKDNGKGYSTNNCVVCCCSCNRTKGDRFSYREFMLLAPTLKKIRLRRKQKP